MYKIKIKEGHDVEEVLEKALRAYRGEVGDDGPLRDPYLRYLHREAKKIYRAVMDAMIEDILDVLDGTDKKSVDTELKKGRSNLVLVDRYANRGGKLHRQGYWVSATDAKKDMLHYARAADPAIKTLDDAVYIDKKSGERRDADGMMRAWRKRGSHRTLQGFIRQKFHVRSKDAAHESPAKVETIDGDDLMRKPVVGKEEEKISIGGVAKDVTIYKIHNSDLNLWTDSPNLTESVQLYTELLNEVSDKIKDVVAMPKAVLIDFGKYGKGEVLGAYVRSDDTIYLNATLKSREEIRNILAKDPDYYAGSDEHYIILHELGHKYHHDTIGEIAKKRNMEYNDAKELLEEPIKKYIVQKELGDRLYLKKQLSRYAAFEFNDGARIIGGTHMNEVFAEYFAVMEKNSELTRFMTNHIKSMKGG